MIKSEDSVYNTFESQSLHLYGSCGTDNIKSITIVTIVIEKKSFTTYLVPICMCIAIRCFR